MPTYEYACRACRHGFETVQRITEDALTICPECGKPSLVRLVGTGNFILKGGGWYADHYTGSGGAKPEAPSASSAEPAAPAAPAKPAEPSGTGGTSE